MLICSLLLLANKEEKTKKMDAKTKTIENMQSAYKGEITATAKYKAFAKKALEDGYTNIATLYNAVSAAENIHAHNHKLVIDDAGKSVPNINPEYIVKSTIENLQDDIKGEAFEANTLYPEYLKTAGEACNQIAHLSLSYAMKTEKKHKEFFEHALHQILAKTPNNLPDTYFVCPACGNTYSTAPKHCDFTLTEKEKFIEFK